MSAVSGIAAREPLTAAAERLADAGIVHRSDDLITGHVTAATGVPVHFGLARITAESLPFWRHYRLSAGRAADALVRLATRLAEPKDRLDLDALAGEQGWSRAELARVAQHLRRRERKAKRVFRSVKGGVTGIEWILDPEFTPTEDRFVAYAARTPFAGWPSPSDEEALDEQAAPLRAHRKRFADLLLTVGVATERRLPTVTHFGIFRNPLAFLDATPEHRGLAMRLHGFAATVCFRALSDKVYMVTKPMPRMAEILRRSLRPDEFYVGDGDADVREYLNRDLPPHLPRLSADRRFSFAGYTFGSRPTAVKLEALARFYRPAGEAPRGSGDERRGDSPTSGHA